MNLDLLTGNTVALRTMRDSDVDLLFDWENRPELSYLGVEHQPLSKAQLSHFINHSKDDIYLDGQLRLMIDSGGQTVGCIDLFEFDQHNQRAGIGILIADAQNRKQGFAAASLTLLTNYCFSVLNFKQLYCHIPVDNEASLRLFTACGFEQTGLCYAWVKKENVFIDAVFMQKING